MRHKHGLRKLNCTSAHRKAKFAALCNALIEHGAITTTLPKAKSLRKVIEPLVSLARNPSVANRRLAFARLNNRKSVTRLFDEIGPRYKDRPGGYTRVLKKGFRVGDAAPMAYVEFVDRDVEVAPPSQPAKTTTAPVAQEQTPTPAEPPAEAPKEVVAQATPAPASSEETPVATPVAEAAKPSEEAKPSSTT